MIRLEFVGMGDHGEDSSKFWEAEIVPGDGVDVHSGARRQFWMVNTRWGRISGPKGQSGQKEFDTEGAAMKEVGSKIKEKIRKGYVIVSGDIT